MTLTPQQEEQLLEALSMFIFEYLEQTSSRDLQDFDKASKGLGLAMAEYLTKAVVRLKKTL